MNARAVRKHNKKVLRANRDRGRLHCCGCGRGTVPGEAVFIPELQYYTVDRNGEEREVSFDDFIAGLAREDGGPA